MAENVKYDIDFKKNGVTISMHAKELNFICENCMCVFSFIYIHTIYIHFLYTKKFFKVASIILQFIKHGSQLLFLY